MMKLIQLIAMVLVSNIAFAESGLSKLPLAAESYICTEEAVVGFKKNHIEEYWGPAKMEPKFQYRIYQKKNGDDSWYVAPVGYEGWLQEAKCDVSHPMLKGKIGIIDQAQCVGMNVLFRFNKRNGRYTYVDVGHFVDEQNMSDKSLPDFISNGSCKYVKEGGKQ